MKTNASSISTIMRHLMAGLAAAGSVALFQPPAAAEDIDLFTQPQGTQGVPNVLIVLDNTANWGQMGPDGVPIWDNEQAALISTVQNLPVNADGSAKFRLGLMLFSESGGGSPPTGNAGVDGGYVRAAIRDLTASNKLLFNDLLNSLIKAGPNPTSDVSNAGKAATAMMEAYYYFSAKAPLTGNLKAKTDYTGNTFGSAQSQAIYALPGNALDSYSDTSYNSPIATGSCGKNFIIFISNGPVQDPASDNRTAGTRLGIAAAAEGIAGALTQIPISPSGSQSNNADEWARFMKQSTQGIVTYTLDVDRTTTGQGPGMTGLLRSMAGVSSGKYFDVASGNGGVDVAAALGTIFSEIQAVNTVFASVSLPVSVTTQGTYLNQIYIGMFRPDADAYPRWFGNMKQYKIGLTAGDLQLQDADSVQATNSVTGFITECARSFWTPPRASGGDDNYWTFKPNGACLNPPDSVNDNSPDGGVVEKGAQAYSLRVPTTGRTPFKTCTHSTVPCTTLVDFDSTSVTQAALGAADTTEQTALINWMRGLDIDDENINGVRTTERRPSSHGDVIHSRPLAINMGTDSSPRVVVIYGANDGVLRAVNGQRDTSLGSVTAGSEMWAFMAPEFYPQIKRLRDNTTPINFFGNAFEPPTPTPLPKPYGFDGPLTAYRSANGSTTWLFATQRRGGRMIYAFDISTIDTNPSSPTLEWVRGCPSLIDDTGCTSGMAEIGQTWSAAKTLTAAGYDDGDSTTPNPSPLLVMGGGYHACEDFDPDQCINTSTGAFLGKGNRVYILDAFSGALLKEFTTERGVASDVVVIPDDTTGLAKWAYVVDIGGNIYRIGSGTDTTAEFGSTDPSAWTMRKIAELGCLSGTCDRKFLSTVDVVKDIDGSYVILVGSGDREKPLEGYTAAAAVDNAFFRVVDHPWDPDWLNGECGISPNEVICLTSLLLINGSSTSNPSATDLLAHPKGWYVTLRDNEQVVTAGLTIFGTTTFSTHIPHVPVAGACASSLGKAFVYNINYANGGAIGEGNLFRSAEVPGGGLLPSATGGRVRLDNNDVVPFCIGCSDEGFGDPDEPIPTGLADQKKSLTYWYIHK